jgi:glycerate 2-kinase
MDNNSSTALEIFENALSSVLPKNLLPQHLQISATHITIVNQAILKSQINKLIVIAAGKAAAAMAQNAEEILGDFISSGICITKYNHSLPLTKFSIIEAAHPLPDNNSVLAGNAVLKLVSNLTENDIVLFLVSGGASALLTDVPANCTLSDIQTTTDLLIKSGATIHQLNAVRKHLSSIKGGQLARVAQPAKVFSLIISDVARNTLEAIASGPTVPDSTTFDEVYNTLSNLDIWRKLPVSIQTHIKNGVIKTIPETPKANAPFFKNTVTKIIGSNNIALQAAKQKASELFYSTTVFNSNVNEPLESFANKLLIEIANYNYILPTCILCSGETTVQVTGNGKGGRNMHLALYLLHKIQEIKNAQITILCCGTDGSDGDTDANGAIINNQLKPHEYIETYLQNFDSYNYFSKYGGLIKTGPTHTNVMDLVIVLIQPL